MPPTIAGPEQGDEFDRLGAIRRIDQSWRNLARRGMLPASASGGLGLPSSSPAGEMVDRGARAIDQAGNYLGAGLAGASEFLPQNILGNFYDAAVGVGEDIGGTVRDFAKYATTARDHRPAAFVGVNDPRSNYGSPNPPPPEETPPTTAQAIDAIEPGGSARVPPQEAAKPARQIDRAPLMVAMGGGPLQAYDPDTSPDIGAPGRGGFVQPDMESLPVGQRPPSYFEDLQKQRAIDMAQPAGGALGEAGFSREDAMPFVGAAHVQDAAARRAMAVEQERQAQARMTEQQREQRHTEKVKAIRADLDEYRKSFPRFVAQLQAQPWSDEQKAQQLKLAQERLEAKEQEARELIEDAVAAAGIGARISSGQMYDRGY